MQIYISALLPPYAYGAWFYQQVAILEHGLQDLL